MTSRAPRSSRRRIRWHAVIGTAVAALAAALLVPAGGAGAFGGPLISGTVWSATDGSPQAGIEVGLYQYVTVGAFGHKIRGTVFRR